MLLSVVAHEREAVGMNYRSSGSGHYSQRDFRMIGRAERAPLAPDEALLFPIIVQSCEWKSSGYAEIQIDAATGNVV